MGDEAEYTWQFRAWAEEFHQTAAMGETPRCDDSSRSHLNGDGAA
jgi:hypothetical protein